MSEALQQDLENLLIKMKRDVLILSIKKYQLSANIIHLITTFDHYLPEMVDWVRKIFASVSDRDTVIQEFHEFLLQVLQESLGVAELHQVIIDDEIETVSMVKNEFVEIIRRIKAELSEYNI